jgi:UDP-N-acetyl-D-glucosamine dehydrogenase
VGLPICLAAVHSGLNVIGFDIDPMKPQFIRKGESYLQHIPNKSVKAAVETGRFEATEDFARLGEPDAILICVPTPLDAHLEPDLSFIEMTCEAIAKRLRPGQLVVLESTTYPGTMTEVVRPILEKSGLICDNLKTAVAADRRH